MVAQHLEHCRLQEDFSQILLPKIEQSSTKPLPPSAIVEIIYRIKHLGISLPEGIATRMDTETGRLVKIATNSIPSCYHIGRFMAEWYKSSTWGIRLAESNLRSPDAALLLVTNKVGKLSNKEADELAEGIELCSSDLVLDPSGFVLAGKAVAVAKSIDGTCEYAHPSGVISQIAHFGAERYKFIYRQVQPHCTGTYPPPENQ